tara:strand:+ start:110 stop:310 length:201 start_codon:yes stop_codon:yes gene_type:complete
MKKIKIGSKYWALKFFSVLIVVCLLGTFLMESLCVLFGTVEVFYSCYAIVMIAGITLLLYSHYKKY